MPKENLPEKKLIVPTGKGADITDSELVNFNASPVPKRSLSARKLDWEDHLDETLVFMYISKKSAVGANGKTFEITHLMDSSDNLYACSLGVNTSALETIERGDIISIKFLGKRQLAGGRMMREFDIELIGHVNE